MNAKNGGSNIMAEIISVKTEYRENPIGIQTQKPRFSWVFAAADGLIQRSCRILVASDPDLLQIGKADKWDSGELTTNRSVNVAYCGRALESCELCYVKVFADTTAGKAESAVFTFEMGLSERDWAISWRTLPLTASGAGIVFRRNITLPADKKVMRARAYVLGLGYHEFYINGKKRGTGVLNPVVSDCNKIVYYNIYDVTDDLKEQNAIGILAGNGWFGSPQIAADLYVRFSDGTDMLIVAKEYERCWKARRSPIVSNTLFDGETYDARIEEELIGWNEYNTSFGLNDGWYFAVPKKHDPAVKIRAQQMEEITVQERIDVVSLHKTENAQIYDFGETLTGWCAVSAAGERGAKITLRFAEKLDESGALDRKSLRNAVNTDTYIFAGRESEQYRPRFSYRGFRYVEVRCEGAVRITELFAERLRTDTRRAGTFCCSDEFLNRLHEMAVRTEECNHHSILTDCPQRDERMGWLNDLSSRIFQTTYNFGMELFFDKISDDMTETMDENGAIKDTAPYYLGGNVADPVSVAYLLIGLFAYERYGDRRIIEKNYENYRKWTEFLTSRIENGLLPLGIYGDWVPAISVVPCVSRRFNKGFPIPLISTMSLYWHYRLIRFFAELTGRAEDEARYRQLGEQTRAAINDAFYDRASAAYCADIQAGNAMALSLGIAEESERPRILDAIVRDIRARGWHMTCGNQSYRHLIGVLADGGRNDVVLRILKNKEYPGWGYMLECGATTVWERWESEISRTEENMHSYCHPMFGSYDYWFYRYLAGIRAEGTEGPYAVEVAPWLTEEIPSVNCTYETLCGKIAVRYEIAGDTVDFWLTVPPNTTATVRLPGETLVLQSGSHRFQRRLKKAAERVS